MYWPVYVTEGILFIFLIITVIKAFVRKRDVEVFGKTIGAMCIMGFMLLFAFLSTSYACIKTIYWLIVAVLVLLTVRLFAVKTEDGIWSIKIVGIILTIAALLMLLMFAIPV